MNLSRLLILFPVAGGLLLAQLTADQKVIDFQYLAGLYAKRYGPYEWKRDLAGFDLLEIVPWLNRINATTNDLQFFDLMSEYVSSLNDAHDVYTLPANFVARLNFSVDIYDGALLVDSINRTRLPANEFPFLVGYQLVSIDGVDAQRVLDGLLRYEVAANPRSTRRLAAELLTVRPQLLIPTAPNVPEISTVRFRRPDGVLESYRVPWTRSGVPLTTVGKYATTRLAAARAEDQEHSYSNVLRRLQNCRLPDRGYDRTVLGFGSRTPVFASALAASGAGCVRRLGGADTDTFYSGVLQAGRYKVGFIRIPDYAPPDVQRAITQFTNEIAFFQANTDGLIIDEMRNPGGSVSYSNRLLGLLIPYDWKSVGFEIRATSEWVLEISSELEQAKASGAPETIAVFQQIKDQIQLANHENRGRTGPIPLDDVTIDRAPARNAEGKLIAYTKPLMVLVDELSASGGDYFAATIQDNARGPLFGFRTMGAGGNVESWEAGSYSQALTTVTESLMRRNIDVVTPDFPATRYVENVGVRPDIEYDYMTRENLVRSGAAFVDAFLDAIERHIQSNE